MPYTVVHWCHVSLQVGQLCCSMITLTARVPDSLMLWLLVIFEVWGWRAYKLTDIAWISDFQVFHFNMLSQRLFRSFFGYTCYKKMIPPLNQLFFTNPHIITILAKKIWEILTFLFFPIPSPLCFSPPNFPIFLLHPTSPPQDTAVGRIIIVEYITPVPL